MAKRKLYNPEIPKMPSGTGEKSKRESLKKRKKDRSGTTSRTRYISDKKTP